MKNFGFVRVAAATPSVKVADCEFNTIETIKLIDEAEKKNVSVIVFPELGISSYTSQDLFLQRALLKESLISLKRICEKTSAYNIISILGLPLEINNSLYNVAAVVRKGKILGLVPKTFLPNYSEFYEKRWFSPATNLTLNSINIDGENIPVGANLIFETSEMKFAIEICEDLWTPIPPSGLHVLHGADVIFNLSASDENAGKHSYRKSLIEQQSARCMAGYVYAAAGNGESTTDVVFSGCSMIAENGSILAEAKRFEFDNQLIVSDIDIERLRNDRIKNKSFSLAGYSILNKSEYRTLEIDQQPNDKLVFHFNRKISPTPFVPPAGLLDERCSEIFSIQTGGLAKRLLHTNIKNVVIGVSGGLDSTLALLVTVKTFDKLNIPRQNIYGITMPGFGTTDRTYNNAVQLMKSLGVTIKEISIKDAVTQHFKDIAHDINTHDITYENSQARERTQILMDYANKVNGLVIGTGDLSELALGWCTYNGDHMSMYAVNSGIPKTLVRTLVVWVADSQMDEQTQSILLDIADTPVSPELLPADENGNIKQKTEDTVGPYELHDFFLYNMMRFGFAPAKIYFLAQQAFAEKYQDATILMWLKTFYRRFFSQQFKRSCMPDGPKVGSINLSPRGDWRMSSDASASLWLKQIEDLR
ncbi:NAD(+) synthase [Dysgonomonas sp. 216]|uniref:NAD(+) synthase n=1 Tax=Dysgonomonas sp. 216 TaxID=2302934 RepID=UPI0013D3154E|nr:NAD(+) synthase [Dysgonomonas sp. 216]NDW17295.1 NAD(+) synthase [Dysgonomonas sp. 216]